jgi:hypothetical protein
VFDVMGTSFGHYNAFQKERLGWLNGNGAPPVTTVQASGTYVIERYPTATTSPKALKIVKQVEPSTGWKTWYYLEYRQPVGFDTALSGSVLNGAVFHMASEGDAKSSDLLDMTPRTSSWFDSTLPLGRSFTDAGAGVTITPLDADGVTMTVRVTFGRGPGGPVCFPEKPTVTLAPAQSQWVRPGTTVTYGVSVTNEDGPSGCSASPFTVQVAPPSGWQVSGPTAPLTIAPGATVSTSTQVTSAPGTPDGLYSVPVTAMRNGSASEGTTAVATYVVHNLDDPAGGVTDGFDRPDSATLGNGWAEMAGDLSITAAVTNGGGKGLDLAVLPELVASSQVAAADFTPDPARIGGRYGIVLRFQDPANYYAVYRQLGSASNVQIAKVVNGVEKILKTGTIASTKGGFRVSGRIAGSVITVAVDGVARATVTDGTFTTGSAGVYLQANLAGHHRVDNFGATLE